MKLTQKKRSLEPCTEAGWNAYDYCLDQPMDDAFILRFRPLGSFLYLSALREPFFKVESDYYIIKGVKNRNAFRIAVHREHEALLEEIERTAGL